MNCNCGNFCTCGYADEKAYGAEKRTPKPLYVSIQRGETWNVMEQDASINYFRDILVNLTEWQAKSIAAILNGGQ